MTAIPVAYGAADLLKVTVSFNYDRYIMNTINIPEVSFFPDQMDGSQSNDSKSEAFEIENAIRQLNGFPPLKPLK
jgi:uncharacterized protein YkwD